MIVWSPSSWALWKQCPAKYRIRHVEKYKRPGLKRDSGYMKLAVPGLVVDKLLQFWLYRKDFTNVDWLDDNFEMVWTMVENEVRPRWTSEAELNACINETMDGLHIAVSMLKELHPEKYHLFPQPSFFEQVTDDFALVGTADLLMADDSTNEAILIDFKNAHSRERMTKDQLVIYQIGLERSTQYTIRKGGYLLFNPRLKQWKWFYLVDRHREKLLTDLKDATEELSKGNFPYYWNHFNCTRFCDVRFSCEMFKQYTKRPQQFEENRP
ncbi:MAG: PD-(D/E)XK nuclease family protein [Bacteroidota bacterium]